VHGTKFRKPRQTENERKRKRRKKKDKKLREKRRKCILTSQTKRKHHYKVCPFC